MLCSFCLHRAAHYWQVYFDTNRLIASAFDTAAYPAPYTVEEYLSGRPVKPSAPPVELEPRPYS
jgi:hypothetical protein